MRYLLQWHFFQAKKPPKKRKKQPDNSWNPSEPSIADASSSRARIQPEKTPHGPVKLRKAKQLQNDETFHLGTKSSKQEFVFKPVIVSLTRIGFLWNFCNHR